MAIQLSERSAFLPEAKSRVRDWGIKLLCQRVKVDSGIGLPNVPMVNVFESTLEWT
jgi:hypothetical protein